MEVKVEFTGVGIQGSGFVLGAAYGNVGRIGPLVVGFTFPIAGRRF